MSFIQRVLATLFVTIVATLIGLIYCEGQILRTRELVYALVGQVALGFVLVIVLIWTAACSAPTAPLPHNHTTWPAHKTMLHASSVS